MNEEMPSQEEQDIAEWYVLKRDIPRPDTTYKKVAICIVKFILINICLSVVLYQVFQQLGIFTYFPDWFNNINASNAVLAGFIFGTAEFAIGIFFVRKMAVIGVVKLYQHYADEDIRRRCLFKPTCSEYSILAVKKYGVIIGLFKTYIRLFFKCRGNIYRIDYP